MTGAEAGKGAGCNELLLSLLKSRPAWDLLYRDTLCALLRQCLGPAPGNSAIWKQAWTTNRGVMMCGIQDMCRQDPSCVDAVLDALRAVADVGEALDMCDDAAFRVDFALAAQNAGVLSFSKWMGDAVAREDGEAVALECMDLATRRYQGEYDSRCGRIKTETLLPLAKSLEQFHGTSLECRAAHQQLRSASRGRLLGGVGPAVGAPATGAPVQGGVGAPVAVAVGAAGGGVPGASVGEPGQQQGQQQQSALFAPDIEEEANSHFQRIYTNKLQIEGVIQMLKGFKTSSNQREQEVFACMIHNLFDEYRFFPRYPERELLITGRLFGSLIQHHLVSSITLGIALRYVLEALRKPLRSNMFKFGMCALEQFKQRLVEWPQYCHHILQITHVRQAHEDLINYIQEALSSSRPAGVAPDGTQAPPMAQQGAPLAPPMGGPPIAPAPGSVPGSAPIQQPAKATGAPGTVPQQQVRLPQQVPGGKPDVLAAPSLAVGASAGRPAGYGAFEGQGGQEMNSFAGFSQGFGQQGSSQLPSNLQSLASDSGAESAQERAATVEMSAAVQQTLSVVSGASAFGATTNIDMLLQQAKEVTAPDSQLQDKIHFIFNNLSNTNLEQKEKELVGVILPHGELFTPWMSQYIVIKRAAQEQNYHSLYLSLIDRLDRTMKSLLKDVICTTIDNIKILLEDEKIKSSSSLRSLLKNLGSWLGSLTLGRNRPILQMRLDFKHLLVDAFEKGKLVAVVPFVAKVLDSTMNSRIFRPPNPWTMMILGLLAELHPMTDLKLNIKFEVEVLCKNLNQELKDVKAATVFKDRTVSKEGNSDWTSRNAATNLGALKPIPQVPDERLMAAAAGLMGGSLGGGSSLGGGMSGSDDKGSGLMPGQTGPGGNTQSQQQQQANQDLANVNVSQFVIINPSISLLQQHPHLVQLVAAGINQAIKDIILPVVERSVTIALITSRELILKDFVFEKDDVIKSAGRMMVQNLAGSLALVTCKEPLRHNMVNQLRGIIQKYFAAAFANEVLDSNALEPAVQMIAQDNLDLGCNLIEKAAVDRAARDMDVALDLALIQRRQPGNQMYEIFKEQQRLLRVLPDALSPKREGGLLPHQRRVYEDFARLLRERPSMQAVASGPGQAMAAGPGMDKALRAFNEAPNHMQQPNLGPQGQVPQATPPQRVDPINQAQLQAIRQALEKCVPCMAKAEEFVMGNFNVLAGSSLSALPQGHELAQLIMQARAFVLQVQGPNREELAVAFSQKLFVRLYDKTKFGRCRLGVDWIMAVLSTLNEITKRVSKEITNWMAVDAERKLNQELTVALVSNRLMSIGSPDYVREMITAMDMGRNQATIDATVNILQACLVDKRLVSTNECAALLDALTTIAQASSRKQGDSLMRLLDGTRNLATAARQQPPAPVVGAADKNKLLQQRNMVPVGKGKDPEEPPGARGEMGFILDKWVSQVQSNNDRGAVQFILQLLQRGFLKGDETTDRFLRLSVELAVERCLVSLDDPAQVAAKVEYLQVDALAQLVAVLLRYFDEWKQTTSMSKVTLFNNVLTVVVKHLHMDHSERKTTFNQKPFHRLLLRLLLDTSDVLGDQTQIGMADALLALQPRLVPGFAFAWLELASHKAFMPRLLQDKEKGSVLFSRILLALFKYLEPFLRSAELHEAVKMLYMGTLRVLLVLLHDFPEFLCEYHFNLCDAIPPSCIQLRNLILSAFPKEMSLPDPLTFQERLPPIEANKAPVIVSNYTAALVAANIRGDLDAFLHGRGSRTLLNDLQAQLLHRNSAEAAASGSRYNIPLINALVLYAAEFAISQGAGDKVPIERGTSMEIFVKLSRDLDNEGRYHFLTAIANQLRYPNHHTHYLSCVMLWLFKSASDKEIVREQLTRVLIERLIVNKPHPWGLLNTFYELIRNPAYEFWRHEFVRSNAQIENLLQNIARFCAPQPAGPPKQVEAGVDGQQAALR